MVSTSTEHSDGQMSPETRKRRSLNDEDDETEVETDCIPKAAKSRSDPTFDNSPSLQYRMIETAEEGEEGEEEVEEP